MPANDAKKSSGIFISYRRSDTPDAVGRIYDRLVSEFGKARVFKDVDSIPLGQDFRGHLNEIVSGCSAVLAIVGPRWADTRNAAGQRRLEDPDDFVRIELEAALARNVPVVPVLVGHAPMPGSAELPTSLGSMAFRQSIEVRPDPDFHNDATRLVSALRAILDPNAPQVERNSAKPKRSWVAWLAGLAMLTTLAAITLAIPALRHLREKPSSEIRTEINVMTQADVRGAIALSPDGKQIVYVQTTAGVSRLLLRALAATTAQALPGTEDARQPFWSPDSRSIGFFTNDALKRLDVGSGAPLTLAPVSDGLGGSWNAEGVILFSQGAGRSLARIAATGGAATEVTHIQSDAIALFSPVFLPDGRRFVYGAAGVTVAGTYLGSLDDTVSARLVAATGNIAYLPSGWLLIWEDSQRALIAQRLDADKAALVGAPVTLAEGVGGAVSASATGLVAYWRGAIENRKRQLQWRDRAGGVLGSIGEEDETYSSPRLSQVGGRVAVVRGETGKSDVWVLEGQRASRVTFDGGSSYPLWSPDGARIAFGSLRSKANGIYQKPADGTGEDQLLQKFDGVFAPASWSADGRYLTYVYVGPRTKMDIGILPMTGGRKSWTFLNSSDFEGAPEFSPDGKWIAYQSDETKRREVYIRPFAILGESEAAAAPSGKWQVSITGGAYPRWSANGKELFFLNPAGDMMAAPISYSGSALAPGTPVKLFPTQVQGGGVSDGGPQYDVARDGRFLINTVLETATTEPSPIILIQNWNPDAVK